MSLSLRSVAATIPPIEVQSWVGRDQTSLYLNLALAVWAGYDAGEHFLTPFVNAQMPPLLTQFFYSLYA